MNFSVSSVVVDWSPAAASLVLVLVYVVVAVAAGRRFGTPALWPVWFAGIVAGSSFPFLGARRVDRALRPRVDAPPHRRPGGADGISAWVIDRTLSGPRPVGIPVQLALGALAFVVAFLVMVVMIFIVIATD